MERQILESTRNPDRSVLAWRGGFLPGWAAVAERVQVVTPAEQNGQSVVTQWESMSGWAAYLLKHVMRVPAQLDQANLTYVNDLKAYCERNAGQTEARCP